MCGIAGIVSPPGSRVDEAALQRMTDALSHRGPDADGVHVDRNVGLGHRRLSVLDTSSSADQPLQGARGETTIVFNGEIYNFRRLRSSLEAQGRSFRTTGDTEVLLGLWDEHGVEMLQHLRGMFALAIHDRRTHQVFLARDRLGQKPLFYARTGGDLVFGSEIKALLTLSGLDRSLCHETLRDYALYGYSVAERSIYRDIRELPPAHCMVLDTRADGHDPRIWRYWTPVPDHASAPREADDWLEEIESRLEEAVRLRMISDVPLGAFLSGGIDSSLIVAAMTRATSTPVRTFAIGFEDPAFDESRYAASVARHLGTEHQTEIVRPDAIEVLPRLTRAFDEPFADSSAIPTFYLAQMTRRHVTVALSGDGADELFYGYQHHRHCQILARAGRVGGSGGRRLARFASRQLLTGRLLQRALDRLSRTGLDLYLHALGNCEENWELLNPDFRQLGVDPTETSTARAYFSGTERTLLQRYQAVDLDLYLPDDILVKVDRTSMAHSLEVRSPFLDHELVELAAQIPPALQIRWREQKLLLRRLAYRTLPRALLERPKRGFGAPLPEWFRNELRPLFQSLLDDKHAQVWDVFDRTTVRHRFENHLSRKIQAEQALWKVLFFHEWSREASA